MPEHINNLSSLREWKRKKNGADISHSIWDVAQMQNFIRKKKHFFGHRHTEQRDSENLLIYVEFIENEPQRMKKLSDFSIISDALSAFSTVVIAVCNRCHVAWISNFMMCLVIFMDPTEFTCCVYSFTENKCAQLKPLFSSPAFNEKNNEQIMRTKRKSYFGFTINSNQGKNFLNLFILGRKLI